MIAAPFFYKFFNLFFATLLKNFISLPRHYFLFNKKFLIP